MGSGGGGGDNGMMMMMMMMQMQQQQEQMRQQAAKAALDGAQTSENTAYQNYRKMVDSQNKKVSGEWDLYNQNIDAIKKINPNYNAHQAYNFSPYKMNPNYAMGQDLDSSKRNLSDLQKWTTGLDEQSLSDYNNAVSQFNASKTWLSQAQATKDAGSLLAPGAPPGTWGAGGNFVSGGAGMDANTKGAQGLGTTDPQNSLLNTGVSNGVNATGAFNSTGSLAGQNPGGLGSASSIGGPGLTGGGYIGGDSSGSPSKLAGMFAGAMGPSPKQASSSFF